MASNQKRPRQRKGTADVLAVAPEEDLVVLRFATGRPPARGREIRIYPIQYLRKLKELWKNDQFAARALAWWEMFTADNAQIDQGSATTCLSSRRDRTE